MPGRTPSPPWTSRSRGERQGRLGGVRDRRRLGDDRGQRLRGEVGHARLRPGQTLQTILVRVEGDDANELDETFDVELSAPVHASLGNATTAVTITNNDPFLPGSAILSVSGASVREGASGTTALLTFTIVRSGETTTAVDVDFVTTNGTASDPKDYLSATGNVAFGANETSKTVDVTVIGDRSLEHKESFFLGLVNPSVGAAIDTGQATGHIINDDTRTRLSITRGAERITAHGRLSPARPGRHMVVRLFRKRNGVWIRLRTSRPVLRGRTDLNGDGFTDSVYRIRFLRPSTGGLQGDRLVPRGSHRRLEQGDQALPLLRRRRASSQLH